MEAMVRWQERIAIDPEKPHIRMPLQQRFRMPAQPDRRIDESSIGAIGYEVLEDFF